MRLASPLLAAGIEELVTEHERVGVLVAGELGARFEKRTVEVLRIAGAGRLTLFDLGRRFPFAPQEKFAVVSRALKGSSDRDERVARVAELGREDGEPVLPPREVVDLEDSLVVAGCDTQQILQVRLPSVLVHRPHDMG